MCPRMLKVTVPASRQVAVFTRQVITVSLNKQGGNPGQTTDVVKYYQMLSICVL